MPGQGRRREFEVLMQQTDVEEGQARVARRDKNLSRGKKALLVLGATGLAAAAAHLVHARVGAPGAGAGDVRGVQSKAHAGAGAGAEAGGSRTMVEDGCWTIDDREACCRHTDGRPWHYHGQDCVPSKPGVEYQNGRVCQPRCWIEGTCVWNHVEVSTEAAGVCPGDKGSQPAATKSEAEAEEEKNTSEEPIVITDAEEDKPSTSTSTSTDAEAEKPSKSTDAEENEAEGEAEDDVEGEAVDKAEDAEDEEDVEEEVAEEVVEEKTLKERGCLQENTTYEPLSMRGETNYTVEKSPEDCQKLCIATDGCTHFSFWTLGNHCYLEGVYGIQQVGRLGFVSGPKVCKDDVKLKMRHKLVNIGARTYVRRVYGCMEVGKIYSPPIAGSVHHYTNTTARKANIMCQQRCADYEGCAYYTLYLPQKDCLLSHANATKLPVASPSLAGPARCGGLEALP